MLNKIKKGSLLFGGFLSLLLTTNCQNLNKQENLKQSIQKHLKHQQDPKSKGKQTSEQNLGEKK